MPWITTGHTPTAYPTCPGRRKLRPLTPLLGRGDRESEAALQALAEGRTWDCVIDTCGFEPRIVQPSVRALAGHAETYAFVSSARRAARGRTNCWEWSARTAGWAN